MSSAAGKSRIRDFEEARKALERSGHARKIDLLMIRPLSYDDETRTTPVAQAVPGVPFLAEVTCLRLRTAGSWKKPIVECLVEDESGKMLVRLMADTAWIRKAFEPGSRVRLFGKVSGGGELGLFGAVGTMVHPRLRSADRDLPQHMTARYPTIGRIAEATLAQMVRSELDAFDGAEDPIPPALRRESGTCPMAESLRILHKPRPGEVADVGRKAVASLKHDEWVAHIAFRRHQNAGLKRRKAPGIPSSDADIDAFERELPFRLTGSQRTAMREVAADLRAGHAMRRLVHGDVGCGKTLVAAFACWLTARAGRLAAVMCPTVILASQHHRRLTPLFEGLGVRCAFLVGSVRGKARREALEAAAGGGSTVVIGTHALVQDKTEMPDLSLAVIDEQHRFGVNQRKALERKGPGAHVLMMSATPIPRTLELGMLSHLDISRMTERPNRADIRTLVFSSKRVDQVLREIVEHDLQAYWICPLIKKSAKLNLRAAEDEFTRISMLAPELRAALIHGRSDAAAKLQAMGDFESGKTRLLVATTVVEVGVDAPEADVIVIDHAERLGLSQLHQLRGRVGRGDKTGFCALLYEPDLSEKAIERLKVIRENSDGFVIAREDLRQRGPGDIVGKRQHGVPKYRFADLDDDPKLLEGARKAAERLLRDHPDDAYRHIRLWMADSAGVKKAPGSPGSRPSAAGRGPGGRSSRGGPRRRSPRG